MQVFSYSKISAFRNCPKSFEFRYLLGEAERFSTIERHMGTSVHEALRWAYAERLEGREPEAEAIVGQYEALWLNGDLARAVVVKAGLRDEDYRLDGRGMVDRFARDVFAGDRSETLGLESRFKMQLDEGVRFTGIIDRICRSPEGKLCVIDYKTGTRVPNPLSDPQLAYYAAWVFENFPDTAAELTFVDLRNGRELTAEYHEGAIVPHIERLLREIDVIRETDTFEASPSMLCKWCGFNPICEDADSVVRRTSASGATASGECPACGSRLVARSGRFGNFIGCSSFPRCRYTQDNR